MHAAHRTEVGDKDSIISLLHTSPVRYLAHFLLGKPKIQNTNRAENQSPTLCLKDYIARPSLETGWCKLDL
jgi:hypothetical protein